MKIGSVEVPNRVVVAPMAGVSTLAFRKIAREFGAGLTCNEMVSDKALYYDSQKTMDMLACDAQDHPVSFQIFGHDVETVVYAARFLDQQTDCDIIDFNMGCPVNKVIKARAGSYLMQDIDYATDLIAQVVKAVNKPVTVKMRTGFTHEQQNCVELATRLEKVGVAALALHGRTRSQMYTGQADWSWIKRVKEAVSIPVMGNGDVRSKEDFDRMLAETGCDAVMIGRGIIGNPFLIAECAGIKVDRSLEACLRLCYQHASDLCAQKGESIGIREMRGLASWYLKGLPHSHETKAQLSNMTSLENLKDILDQYSVVVF